VKTRPKHDSSLAYTNEDDGIWLRCSCGWQVCLGFWPTLSKAKSVWHKHLHEVGVV
jgi:hypothetical protein